MPCKIAYVFKDQPNDCSGPRINALRLLPQLVRRGYEVTAIITYRKAAPAQPVLEREGVACRTLDWPRFTDQQTQLLYKELSLLQPDVFVPNISISGCYAARFLREAGCPTIAGHLSNDRFNWALAERFCKAGDEWAVSGLFCMGHDLADRVRAWRPQRTQVLEIPHGVPMPPDVAAPHGPLRLVYAGRLLERQKRISEVVQAFITALRHHRDATAKLIGDGSRRPVVERMIHNSQVASRFRLTGYTPPDQVQQEMLAGNVIVLLSDYEGVPGAVMDGMACGLVPVCLDIPGGLRELVIHEETGLLVKDRGEDFQNALRRLAEDEGLRCRLAENARRHIREHFSLAVAIERWEQLIGAVLEQAGPRREIRFPADPVLPHPYYRFAKEDRRSPSPYGPVYDAWTALPHKAAGWVRDRLFVPPERQQVRGHRR